MRLIAHMLIILYNKDMIKNSKDFKKRKKRKR